MFTVIGFKMSPYRYTFEQLAARPQEQWCPIPIGSMGRLYMYLHFLPKLPLHVGKYTIHVSFWDTWMSMEVIVTS